MVLRYLCGSTKQIFHPLDNRAGLIHKLFDQNLEILAAGGIDVQIGLFGFGQEFGIPGSASGKPY